MHPENGPHPHTCQAEKAIKKPGGELRLPALFDFAKNEQNPTCFCVIIYFN
jgi:hypothetical protein